MGSNGELMMTKAHSLFQGRNNHFSRFLPCWNAYQMFGVIRNFDETKFQVLTDFVKFQGNFKVFTIFK